MKRKLRARVAMWHLCIIYDDLYIVNMVNMEATFPRAVLYIGTCKLDLNIHPYLDTLPRDKTH